MLIGRAKDFYYEKLVKSPLGFDQLIKVVQGHFETAENRQKYLGDWQSTTLQQVIKRNRDKSKLECLDILFDTLVRIQKALGKDELELKEQITFAVRAVPECSLAVYTPAISVESLRTNLRSAIGTAIRQKQATPAYTSEDTYEQNYGDRKYGGKGNSRSRYSSHSRGRDRSGGRSPYRGPPPKNKNCFVCGKIGCWLRNHTLEERKVSFEAYKKGLPSKRPPLQKEQYYYAFLGTVEAYEGPEGREDQIRFFEELDAEEAKEREDTDEDLEGEGREGAIG
jgi:hypothetical protein